MVECKGINESFPPQDICGINAYVPDLRMEHRDVIKIELVGGAPPSSSDK